MGFGQAISSGFKKYITFSGRSSRSEYWWWLLFTFLLGLVMGMLDGMLGMVGDTGLGTLGGLATLITILPSIAVGVRRFHDIGMSGWWYLVFLIPIVGLFFLVFWFTKKGDEGDNRFGPDPLGTDAAEVFS